MIDLIISKLLLPLTLKGLEVLISFIKRWILDYIDGQKEDRTDRENREEMKNPNRGDVARRINDGFDP
jgi:hypothetical protein